MAVDNLYELGLQDTRADVLIILVGKKNNGRKAWSIRRGKILDVCREFEIPYGVHTSYGVRALFLMKDKGGSESPKRFALETPLREERFYVSRGTELSATFKKSDLKALSWGEHEGKKIEEVLKQSGVTVWRILAFSKELTCEMVVWKKGRHDESVAKRLLGVEFVESPYGYCDTELEEWEWAGIYDKNNKQFAEGGITGRRCSFSDAALKIEAETCGGSCAVKGARLSKYPDKAGAYRHPIVDIVQVSRGWRVTVKEQPWLVYLITRPGCMEIIKKLKMGIAYSFKDKKGKPLNVRARFQHASKGLLEDEHTRFSKKHLVAVGHGYWKIVAEK